MSAMQQASSTYRREPIGKVLLIDHPAAEGIIAIDSSTGQPLTKLDATPEWASHLACAYLAEREEFYTSRLGAEGASPILAKDTVSFADLKWIGVSMEQEEVEIEASPDFRSATLAEALGVQDDGTVKDARLLVDAETDRTPVMTSSEAEATSRDIAGGGGQSFKDEQADRRAVRK